MQDSAIHTNEQSVEKAFSKQSFVFDEIYANNSIVHYKRERVRNHLQVYLSPKSNILELNSGTGEDAIWFARQGHSVHATDISNGMLQMLTKKTEAAGLNDKITNEQCSFTNLEKLKNKGPYDLVFSNFAGLNCTNELNKVLQSIPSLLKEKGIATLVILPRFCLWETLLVFKGKFRTAFRRFSGSSGATAKVEGQLFKCWYYNPAYVIKNCTLGMELLAIEGLCTIVPPSYIEHFAEKHPSVFKWLTKKESQLKSRWPWRNIGDYYIITLRKKQTSNSL
ncbi:MAG: class I SAM-dependent methyltransferase [Chitinophagaceae bacterium]